MYSVQTKVQWYMNHYSCTIVSLIDTCVVAGLIGTFLGCWLIVLLAVALQGMAEACVVLLVTVFVAKLEVALSHFMVG